MKMMAVQNDETMATDDGEHNMHNSKNSLTAGDCSKSNDEHTNSSSNGETTTINVKENGKNLEHHSSTAPFEEAATASDENNGLNNNNTPSVCLADDDDGDANGDSSTSAAQSSTGRLDPQTHQSSSNSTTNESDLPTETGTERMYKSSEQYDDYSTNQKPTEGSRPCTFLSSDPAEPTETLPVIASKPGIVEIASKSGEEEPQSSDDAHANTNNRLVPVEINLSIISDHPPAFVGRDEQTDDVLTETQPIVPAKTEAKGNTEANSGTVIGAPPVVQSDEEEEEEEAEEESAPANNTRLVEEDDIPLDSNHPPASLGGGEPTDGRTKIQPIVLAKEEAEGNTTATNEAALPPRLVVEGDILISDHSPAPVGNEPDGPNQTRSIPIDANEESALPSSNKVPLEAEQATLASRHGNDVVGGDSDRISSPSSQEQAQIDDAVVENDSPERLQQQQQQQQQSHGDFHCHRQQQQQELLDQAVTRRQCNGTAPPKKQQNALAVVDGNISMSPSSQQQQQQQFLEQAVRRQSGGSKKKHQPQQQQQQSLNKPRRRQNSSIKNGNIVDLVFRDTTPLGIEIKRYHDFGLVMVGRFLPNSQAEMLCKEEAKLDPRIFFNAKIIQVNGKDRHELGDIEFHKEIKDPQRPKYCRFELSAASILHVEQQQKQKRRKTKSKSKKRDELLKMARLASKTVRENDEDVDDAGDDDGNGGGGGGGYNEEELQRLLQSMELMNAVIEVTAESKQKSGHLLQEMEKMNTMIENESSPSKKSTNSNNNSNSKRSTGRIIEQGIKSLSRIRQSSFLSSNSSNNSVSRITDNDVDDDDEEEEQLKRSLKQQALDVDETYQFEVLRQESKNACLKAIHDHLLMFVQDYPDATYEEWIEELHPENAKSKSINTMVDHRLYSERSDHRQIWNENLTYGEDEEDGTSRRTYVPVRPYIHSCD